MGRLIVVPQYPTPLRYQEWWIKEFPKKYSTFFSEVIVLDDVWKRMEWQNMFNQNPEEFAPLKVSVYYELNQIKQALSIVESDDCLLLCDLSYPGIFASTLMYIDCKKFAICHATSKNRYDYFASKRSIKYPLERIHAKMFDKIFVGSKYHAEKLGWSNIEITYLPLPPNYETPPPNYNYNISTIKPLHRREYDLVSVARPGVQKITKKWEKQLEEDLQMKIHRPKIEPAWDSYYDFLQQSKIMVITSKEETFGYQVVDAVMNGVIPIAPNRFSYPELIPKTFLYNNYEDLKRTVRMVLKEIHSFKKPTINLEPKLLVEKECTNFYYNTSKIMINE